MHDYDKYTYEEIIKRGVTEDGTVKPEVES